MKDEFLISALIGLCASASVVAAAAPDTFKQCLKRLLDEGYTVEMANQKCVSIEKKNPSQKKAKKPREAKVREETKIPNPRNTGDFR